MAITAAIITAAVVAGTTAYAADRARKEKLNVERTQKRATNEAREAEAARRRQLALAAGREAARRRRAIAGQGGLDGVGVLTSAAGVGGTAAGQRSTLLGA